MALQSDIKSTQWTFDINTPGGIVQGLDSIKQCVFLILTTSRGTDPLRPDFGCGAYDYLDYPATVAVPRMVKAIQDALIKYEPRIEDVKVTTIANLSNFTFRLSWKVKNTVINDQLNITYGGGSST
jgi:phage baseplate assembly protein W